MISITIYKSTHKELWNDFVNQSANGTFLFNRDFMDYHKDRFDDFSLLFFQNDILLAVLPAHRIDNALFSHWGLSYGGFVLSKKVKTLLFTQIFDVFLRFLQENNFLRYLVKPIPEIYQKQKSLYESFFYLKYGFTIISSDANYVLDIQNDIEFQTRKKRNIQKAISQNLFVTKSNKYEEFWNNILVENLKNAHQVNPTHTAQEIELLAQKFKNNIDFYTVNDKNNRVIAGTVLFLNSNVVHAQYIAANETGKNLGALDFLFENLIQEYKSEYHYFSFGISSFNQGKSLNLGLAEWKEGFGAFLVSNFTWEFNII